MLLLHLMLLLVFCHPIGNGQVREWEVDASFQLPGTDGRVAAVAWDPNRVRGFLARTGDPTILVFDQDGPIDTMDLGLEFPVFLGYRNDTLFASDPRLQTLLTADLRSGTTDSLSWVRHLPGTQAVAYPGMLMIDGTIWGRARGIDGSQVPVTRGFFQRAGATADTLGIMQKPLQYLVLRDPNGRIREEFRMGDPLGRASWADVSRNGRWASLLNQSQEHDGIQEIQLTSVERGVGRYQIRLFPKERVLSDLDRESLSNELAAIFRSTRRPMLESWAQAGLKARVARPLATGLVQAENGEVWIRSGLGLWGTREWCIVEPRSGRSTEIELPVSVEVLWVDGHRLIGVNQIPGQEGTLYFMRTRGGG
jgi:hypothetical protein